MRTVATDERTPYAIAARQLLRDTLLDSANAELTRRPWAQITMSDIASAAGVSRQTLYKEFGSREAFAQALVIREGDRFLASVERAVGEHLDDPAAALAAAFDEFLAAAAENPLVRAIVLDGGAEDLLALFTTHGGPVVARAAERLAAIMTAGWPKVNAADAELLAECLVRLAISYVALPRERPPSTTDAVMRLLAPYIERALLGID